MRVQITHIPGRFAGFLTAAVLTCCMGSILLMSAQAGARATRARALSARMDRTVRAFPYSRFIVRGTHKFKLIISGTPQGVQLIAIRRSEAVQYVTFSGYADGSGLDANFGGLGHIAVRFHPIGRYTSGPLPGQLGKCQPLGRPTERIGNFTGSIEFHGENNFTRVRLHHAQGRAGPSRKLRCPTSRSKSVKVPPTVEAPSLKAHFRHVSFLAGAGILSELRILKEHDLLDSYLVLPRGPGVPFAAESRELQRGMLVSRVVMVKGSNSSFMADIGAQTAQIEPPAPFEGMVTLNECPVTEWRGRMSVRFPGKNVRLAPRGGIGSATLKPRRGCPDV